MLCLMLLTWLRGVLVYLLVAPFDHRRKNQQQLVTVVGVKKAKWPALQESNLRPSASEADTLSN